MRVLWNGLPSHFSEGSVTVALTGYTTLPALATGEYGPTLSPPLREKRKRYMPLLPGLPRLQRKPTSRPFQASIFHFPMFTLAVIVSIKGQWEARLRYTTCLLQCLLWSPLLLALL